MDANDVASLVSMFRELTDDMKAQSSVFIPYGTTKPKIKISINFGPIDPEHCSEHQDFHGLFGTRI